MADENKPKQGQINIELDGEVAQGIYSNLAIINHSQSEFVDCINASACQAIFKSAGRKYKPFRKGTW